MLRRLLDSQVNRSNNYIVSSVAKLLNNFYLASSDKNQRQYSMCVQ